MNDIARREQYIESAMERIADLERSIEFEQAAHTVCAEARGRETEQYERVLNDYVQENQRFSERLEQQWAENGQLRAALKEIVEIDHYPDATIARKALNEQIAARVD